MNKQLLQWSDSQYCDLPWRKNRTLYTTLVSEIMLQQTSVTTVKKHFDRFLKKFPNISSLAKASEEEVMLAWQGLGYYRRARNLKKAAETIHKDYKGEFPKKFEELIQIPGIGHYTANALIAIGRNEKAIALDANLERVFARFYGIQEEKGPKLQKKLYQLFEEGKIAKEIKTLGARSLNEALMDLGRVFCQAKKAECLICPLQKKCIATKTKNPLSYPLTNQKIKESYELKLIRVLVKKGNSILGLKRKEGEWLSGQIELPTFIYSSEDSTLNQYPKWKKKINLDQLPSIKTGITKYKIQNYVLNLTSQELKKVFSENKNLKFYNIKSEDTHFSTTTLKILDRIEI